MPTTVKQLFGYFGIAKFNQVRWGTAFIEKGEGIYVVSTGPSPEKHIGISEQPNFDDEEISKWIDKFPDFKIDDSIANSALLKTRLRQFWLRDESILYIGKASRRLNGTGISKRVTEFYSTPIGDRSPHAGGHWIKTLQNLSSLTVYYCCCNYSFAIENEMLNFFIGNVSEKSRSTLFDYNMPLPFANIKLKRDKKHGLKNYKV